MICTYSHIFKFDPLFWSHTTCTIFTTFLNFHIKGILLQTVYWEALLMCITWTAGDILWIIIPRVVLDGCCRVVGFSVRKLWTLHLPGVIIFSCFILLHFLHGISPKLVFYTNIICGHHSMQLWYRLMILSSLCCLGKAINISLHVSRLHGVVDYHVTYVTGK